MDIGGYPVTISPDQAAGPERIILDTANFRICAIQVSKHFFDGICYHQDQFFLYNGTHYKVCTDKELKAKLRTLLSKCYKIVYEDKELKEQQIITTRRLLGEILEELQSLWISRQDAPTFMNEDTAKRYQHPANEFIPLRNGLFHWPSETLYPHTSDFFCLFCLPFDFDKEVYAVPRWDQFLQEAFPSDQQTKDLLEEIFGYIITGDRKLHKIPCFIGVSRGGKSTLATLLQEMMGEGNSVATSIKSLGSDFGIQSLIGKPLAVLSDARKGKWTDIDVVYQRLKAISGMDEVDISRKYLTTWIGVLPTRFLIVLNEWPKLTDIPAELRERFVVVSFKISHADRADPLLIDKLRAERSAIFNRAIIAYKKLAERKRFTQPNASQKEVDELRAIANPLLPFIAEYCDIGSKQDVLKGDLYKVYDNWCAANDEVLHPREQFGKYLRLAVPNVTVKRPDSSKRETDRYVGVGLKTRRHAEAEKAG